MISLQSDAEAHKAVAVRRVPVEAIRRAAEARVIAPVAAVEYNRIVFHNDGHDLQTKVSANTVNAKR